MDLTTSDYAAWFGALGTVLLMSLEIWKWYSNKPRLQIKTRFETVIFTVAIGNIEKNSGREKLYWTINLVNRGDLDIIIQSINIRYKGKRERQFALITRTYEGQFSKFTLTKHNSQMFTIAYKSVDPSEIDQVIVESARGDQYKSKVKYKLSKPSK